ncbi:MAG TPA: AmpG family muropeptide MFS transporter [Bacteroidales bacterium]|nr:AmpG family muropeptide MFS transporter [Bacteroidales bacterium]
MENTKQESGWRWIPSLYFVQGLPYVMVMTVSVIMYKRLGLSNTDIALYTSWLYLPWFIKPLWSPFVDLLRTKRWWILVMQLVMGGGLAGVALSIPVDPFVRYTLAFFWLLAFSSATHDIAADGFYMLGLKEDEQAFFVGIRSSFYRLAMMTGQGLLVMLAGWLEQRMGVARAWQITFVAMALLLVLAALWHWWSLPRPQNDGATEAQTGAELWRGVGASLGSFFAKPGMKVAVAFMLLYRLGEAQLVKLAAPFLMDAREVGGLALSTETVGLLYGTIGVVALTLGGILGGWLITRKGLRYWLWPMALAMNLPNLAYVVLAWWQPESMPMVAALVALEQLGYGFGFTAYVLFLIHYADGPYKTAHYAIGTGLMALGMMLPGMASGWLQELLGYRFFFIWVVLCTLPGFALLSRLKIPAQFGRKNQGFTKN